MNDEEFERLMRDAAHSYNTPRELADADATWQAIERALPAAGEQAPSMHRNDDGVSRRSSVRGAWARPWTHPLARMAAMLLVGVAVGRATVRRDPPSAPATIDTSSSTVVAEHSTTRDVVVPTAAQVATDRYLARTAVLLAGLNDELRRGRRDAAFLGQADVLLLQTRLLLDSPAAADPQLRALLDDLEVVLAQVVRLDARRDPVEVDFLHEALEQRDVIPRLREAVADIATE